MKLVHRILFISLALFFSANLAMAVPGRAEVKLVVATATVTTAAGASSPLTVGMVLGPGDTLSTGKDSSVALWLGINGETLLVAANTTLIIEKLEITSVEDRIVQTTLNVTKGKVIGAVKQKLAAASRFEIKSAKGIARITGTQYAFDNDGTLVVLEGAVTYTYTENGVTKSVDVAQGQKFKIGDPAPTDYIPGIEVNAEALSFFADLLNESGINISASDGTLAVLKALASSLDVSESVLKEYLISAGVAREVPIPTGTVHQPLDTTVISRAL